MGASMASVQWMYTFCWAGISSLVLATNKIEMVDTKNLKWTIIYLVPTYVKRKYPNKDRVYGTRVSGHGYESFFRLAVGDVPQRIDLSSLLYGICIHDQIAITFYVTTSSIGLERLGS